MASPKKDKIVTSLNLPDGVPEFLVDGFNNVAIANDIARFNFFAIRSSAKGGEGHPTLVCRLAFSLPSLVAMQQSLARLVVDLEKDGILKVEGDKNGG